MTKTLPLASLAVCLLSLPSVAGESRTVTYLDKFHVVDPKSVRVNQLKLQVVSGEDAAHNRALELTADFAKPGAWTHLVKTFAAGTINSKKHSGLCFYMKSPTGTCVSVHMTGNYKRPDGRLTSFYGGHFVGNDQWKEVKIPFANFRRKSARVWTDGAHTNVQGVDPMEEFEIGQINSITFAMNVETRGNSTLAKVLLEGLSLAEQ